MDMLHPVSDGLREALDLVSMRGTGRKWSGESDCHEAFTFKRELRKRAKSTPNLKAKGMPTDSVAPKIRPPELHRTTRDYQMGLSPCWNEFKHNKNRRIEVRKTFTISSFNQNSMERRENMPSEAQTFPQSFLFLKLFLKHF